MKMEWMGVVSPQNTSGLIHKNYIDYLADFSCKYVEFRVPSVILDTDFQGVGMFLVELGKV